MPQPTDWRARVYASGPADAMVPRHRKPSGRRQRDLLSEFDWCCAYCGGRFGGYVQRGQHHVAVRLNWDHFVPRTLCAKNDDENFVPACSVCNNIKSCLVFDTLQAAWDFIEPRRFLKGYR